jgi:hypothetical protein
MQRTVAKTEHGILAVEIGVGRLTPRSPGRLPSFDAAGRGMVESLRDVGEWLKWLLDIV